MCDRLDVLHMENLRRVTFLIKMFSNLNCNNIIKCLRVNYLNSGEYFELISKYNCDFNWSIAKVKHHVYNSFKELVAIC